MNKKILCGSAVIAMLISSATVYAKGGPGKSDLLYNPNTPSLTVVNTISDVDGFVGGFIDGNGDINYDMMNPDNVSIIYPISGEVYATLTNGVTGETLGSFNQKGTISATVLFPTTFFGLAPDPLSGQINWGALPATMPWTMTNELADYSEFAMKVNGTTFSFDQELTGRAFPHLGPVENPQETGTLALRMAGCAGIHANDQGDYAGKVGTLCLNGTFTFDQDFSGVGVSNCSIAIHDPLYAPVVEE